MTAYQDTIDRIRIGIRKEITPAIDELVELISPITIGLTQPMPIIYEGGRLFRVRMLADKPSNRSLVGAPPVGVATRGRINEEGTSVLYLSDTPATALKEAGVSKGECCLSEWRVDCKRLGLVNGGLTSELLKNRFPNHISPADAPKPTEQDELVMALFRDVFTLDVGDDNERYAWSVAAGRAGGFSHKSGLKEKIEQDSFTKIIGDTPFSALVYPSVRADRLSLNYVLNHQGMGHVSLQNVQWISVQGDGRIRSLDISTSWIEDGTLKWKGRPAKFVLKPGEAAKLTKTGPNQWDYETADGSLPWYK